MTTALEIGGACLLASTLLAAAVVRSAFQLGRLITRDDEQRAVEAAGAPKVAIHSRRNFCDPIKLANPVSG